MILLKILLRNSWWANNTDAKLVHVNHVLSLSISNIIRKYLKVLPLFS